MPRGFDPHNFGAKVSKDAAAERASPHPGQIQDSKASERPTLNIAWLPRAWTRVLSMGEGEWRARCPNRRIRLEWPKECPVDELGVIHKLKRVQKWRGRYPHRLEQINDFGHGATAQPFRERLVEQLGVTLEVHGRIDVGMVKQMEQAGNSQ